jgi:hypothetical protein
VARHGSEVSISYRHERAVQELDKQYQQALEEKNILAEQLQVKYFSEPA